MLLPSAFRSSSFPKSFTGSFSDWESEDDSSDLFCPPIPFYLAFCGLVCFWVLMPLLFLCQCCAMCYKMANRSAEVGVIS